MDYFHEPTIKFCFKCGAKLLTLKTRTYGFEQQTGKPILEVQLKCPNIRWWNFTKHTRIWEFKKDGGEAEK